MHERAVGDRRELWRAIDPLLPPEPPKPQGGRYRVPDRACLTGIIFVLKSELPREHFPRRTGCGQVRWKSGVGCVTGSEWVCGNNSTILERFDGKVTTGPGSSEFQQTSMRIVC